MNSIKYILLLIAFVLLGCNNDKKESPLPSSTERKNELVQLSKAQFENAKMELGSLSEQPFVQTIQSTGVIDVPPENIAVISSFSGGYVKNTPLIIGDKVTKGQRLVTIENPEFITLQQNYLETSGQLSYLKSEFERQKTMLEENITSQKSFLKAESEYKTALARNTSLRKNLQMLNINPASVERGNIVSQADVFSPIDGNVTQVFVNTGTYVSPADKIMEIMNTDHIHLELKVFEKDLLQLKKDQELLFSVPEASKEVFNGKIHLVGTTINPTTRIATVHGHIAEKDERNFTPGMFVDAGIITGTENHLALPEEAIVELEGKHFVLLLNERNKDGFDFIPIEVKVGPTHNGFTVVENAVQFKADSVFLTKGGFVLLQIESAGGHGQ